MSSAPPADESPPPHGARGPYRSFWMGGYEGADHVNGQGRALDLVRATGHLDRLDEDYRAAARLGLRSLRESVGWRLAEPAPGRYDFARAHRMARAARRHGVQLLWTVMHYGTPTDLSLFDDALIDRFARFAGALAVELAPYADDAEPPVYTLVNEIGFVAWAACTAARAAGAAPRTAATRSSGASCARCWRRSTRCGARIRARASCTSSRWSTWRRRPTGPSWRRARARSPATSGRRGT